MSGFDTPVELRERAFDPLATSGPRSNSALFSFLLVCYLDVRVGVRLGGRLLVCMGGRTTAPLD